MLDWSELRSQIAEFAQTSKGRQDLLEMQPAASQERSEVLAAETRAADTLEAELAVQLNFGGVNTLEAHTALMRASRGGMLDGQQLKEIRQTIVAGQRLRRQIQGACRSEDVGTSELRPVMLAASQVQAHEEITADIAACIDEHGRVRDTASTELERARNRVASLEGRVKSILKSYPGEVIEHADRWVVAMGDLSAIPPKALVVGSSSGGAMQYVEPQAAVPINSEIGTAKSLAHAAEETVLWQLTRQVEVVLEEVQVTLQTVCWLDSITAKARFGNWIGGTFATFVPFPKTGKARGGAAKAQASSEEPRWLIQLRRLKHPLLLANFMKKKGKLRDGSTASRQAASARQRLLQSSKMAQRNAGPAGKNSGRAPQEPSVVEPVASDLCISEGTRALIITGPNTGGKTITLKALGLVSLMARCGVAVPAAHPAQLPCFSSVLADIGDEQSLSASLSTFSGHLKRIQDLRSESDSKSLVLLDEVGTGTDPSEGTALGIALLRALAKGGPGGAAFTMATTHMGALTSLKYSDGVFENACVEFNEDELRPTYRLLLGVPGRSNALNIAERLGLDGKVIETARERMGSDRLDVNNAILQLERLKQQAQANDEACKNIDVKMARVGIEYRKLKRELDELQANTEIKSADKIAALVKSTRAMLDSNDAVVKKREKASTRKSSPQTVVPEQSARLPEVGDKVFVAKLQKQASVVRVKKNKLDLKVGSLTVSAKIDEVELVL